jgi:hypothetical protein
LAGLGGARGLREVGRSQVPGWQGHRSAGKGTGGGRLGKAGAGNDKTGDEQRQRKQRSGDDAGGAT